MRKFRIEILVSVLTVTVGLVVATIGYLSYKSLTKIVFAIQEGTQPDNKVFLIKDIAADLTMLGQSVRFYVLTGSNDDLEQYYFMQDSIVRHIEDLNKLEPGDQLDKILIDSFVKLSDDKLNLWDKILTTQLSKQSFFPSFSQVFSDISERQSDTTSARKDNVVPETFSGSLKAEADTSIQKSRVELEVRRKIRQMEWEMYKKRKRNNVIESKLIEQDVVISSQINQLIREAENKKATDLVKNTQEVDQLADQTIQRLAVYTFSAFFLLLLTLFVLFIYLRKSRFMSKTLTIARKKAEMLATAKEQFAANVSHELRTPVNSIYGLAEQLQQKKFDHNTSEMISVIFNSANHLRNIVNDTLDFSKIQSQKLKLDKTGFSPVVVFNEVISLFKNEAKNKGIVLGFDWTGEKPECLVGDPFRLKQMIINLVGNAIKFTEKGEVVLKVKGKKYDFQKYELEIAVIDTGIGIDTDKIRFVFDEYVQIDNPAGKKYRGTGLGLSIVKKLVELHEGQIEFESTPGKGTKATIKIRYDEGQELQAEKGNEKMIVPDSFKNLSVLIADDEEYNRFLLKNILVKWGIRYNEAQTGDDAVFSVQNEKVDVILMDLHMPGMNGIGAARQILKKWPATVIIAVSATVDEKERKACINAGMKGFLFKPFSEKELFDLMCSVIPPGPGKESAGTDYSDYIKRFSNLAGDDKNFFIEMIQLFIKSMESGINEIEEAIKTGNWDVVFRNAHRMAAPVKHIAAEKLYSHIKQLEKEAQQPDPAKPVAEAFAVIKPEIEGLIVFLKLYLGENKE